MLKSKSKVTMVISLLVLTLVASMFAGCGAKKPEVAKPASTPAATGQAKPAETGPTKEAVQKEGKIVTYGMPDEWANYGEIFKIFNANYGITHQDTDMSSAEELAKFKAEQNNPVADLGDVGITFGNVAKVQGVVQPYKNKFWNEVPDWAKDKDGYWTGAYTGSIAFLVNKKLVKAVPKSWKDLLSADYKNCIVTGDMLKAAQSQNALLAVAFANGGDETNLKPGIDYFAKLMKAGNLKTIDNRIGNFQKGEIPVGMLWDFNALGYKSQMPNPDDYEVVIPSDGTVVSAYVSVINKWAPHPNAAKAFQDYLFSDEGQIKLAKGFSRPIRKVTIPADVAKNLIPDVQYASAKPIKDYSAWEKSVKEIPDLWRNNVLAQ